MYLKKMFTITLLAMLAVGLGVGFFQSLVFSPEDVLNDNQISLLPDSRQHPASDYYEGVDEWTSFNSVLVAPNTTYVALYSDYTRPAGGQANYGQLGYIWSWTSTGDVSFYLVNSTYWDGSYPVGGSLMEVINVTSSDGEQKLPSSDGTNMGEGPTTQLHFRWVFWNQGSSAVYVTGNIDRYMTPPVMTVGIEEDYPNCFFGGEGSPPEYYDLFWNGTGLDAPPYDDQLPQGYHEWNVSITTDHFDASLCYTIAIMHPTDIQNAQVYLTNYENPEGTDGNNSRQGDNIWMAFNTSDFLSGWHHMVIRVSDECENNERWDMYFYIQSESGPSSPLGQEHSIILVGDDSEEGGGAVAITTRQEIPVDYNFFTLSGVMGSLVVIAIGFLALTRGRAVEPKHLSDFVFSARAEPRGD